MKWNQMKPYVIGIKIRDKSWVIRPQWRRYTLNEAVGNYVASTGVNPRVDYIYLGGGGDAPSFDEWTLPPDEKSF